MTKEELMLIAGEFLNSEKWLHAVNTSYTAQQTAQAEFAAEVLRVERARVEAREGEQQPWKL